MNIYAVGGAIRDELLGVPVQTVRGGGHFLDRDGWTTLPHARDAVLGMLGR